MILLEHWSLDPFLAVAVVVALVHERGLRRLNRHAPAARARQRRIRSLSFYGGLAVLLVAVCSPVDYWSDEYLWTHMVQHLLLLFAAPAAIVAGAPWLPLQHGLPASIRRPAARSLLVGAWSAPLRRFGRLLAHPLTAVVGLNVVVVVWHLPGPLDLAEEDPAVHVWLMHASFFLFGVLFFLQLVNSHPLQVRLSPQGQMAAIFATAVAFWVFAMAMGLFSAAAWYPWYKAHEGPLLTPYADQQIAAGAMWVFGDFWAVPAMIVAIRRLQDGRAGGRRARQPDRPRSARRGLATPGRVHAELARREAALERQHLERRTSAALVREPVPAPDARDGRCGPSEA